MSKMARLGLFLLTALAVLVAAIFVIGNQQRLFSRSYRLRAQFPNVSGLLAGAEVRVGGVRMGTVEAIQLPARPTDQVLVTMSLDRETAALVKRDSLAAIETEGLLGSKYMAVSFGSPDADRVRDWDQIASEPPLDVSGLLKKTTDLMDTTQHVMKNLDTVAGQLASVSTRVARGDGTLGALLKDRSLYDQLTGTATQAQATMTQAKAGVTAFQENMEALKGNILFRGYFKNRGYQDAADLTRWELPALPPEAPAKTFTLAASELFAPAGSAKLKDGKRLEAAGAYLEKNPFRLAVIQAFAGLKGNHEDNLALTRAQAMVVRTYLSVTFELDDTKVKTRAMGETATTQGEDGRIVIAVY